MAGLYKRLDFGEHAARRLNIFMEIIYYSWIKHRYHISWCGSLVVHFTGVQITQVSSFQVHAFYKVETNRSRDG